MVFKYTGVIAVDLIFAAKIHILFDVNAVNDKFFHGIDII